MSPANIAPGTRALRWLRPASMTHRRLAVLLGLLFIALALPAVVLVRLGFGQLDLEALRRQQLAAESFTSRLDSGLGTIIAREEARPPGHYTFLLGGGSGDADGASRRSPLSMLDPLDALPGLIAYFQVDADGRLTTPLLPPDDDLRSYDLDDPADVAARQLREATLRRILADNRLVGRPVPAAPAAAPGPGSAPEAVSESVSEPGPVFAPAAASRAIEVAPASANGVFESAEAVERERANAASSAVLRDAGSADDFAEAEEAAAVNVAAPSVATSVAPAVAPAAAPAAQRFESQAARRRAVAAPEADELADRRDGGGAADEAPASARSQPLATAVTGQAVFDQLSAEAQALANARTAGVEPAVPTAGPAGPESDAAPTAVADRITVDADTAGRGAAELGSAAAEAAVVLDDLADDIAAEEARRAVGTFATDVEPLVFSRLETGHYVLFRNAWRDGRRDVQGMLIDAGLFVADAIAAPFAAAAFDPGVALAVDVAGATVAGAPDRSARPIVRTRLSPPLGDIALTFSGSRLPAGPLRAALLWSAAAFFVMLAGGIYAIYRFGVGQIALARQQRTFVSAVSHELKTPLTSIRMYGELLRSGWADEAKRNTYYDFIYTESERLSRLIDNVLALARIERREAPALEPASVAEVLDMVRSKTAAALQQAGFELEVDCDASLADAEVDIDPDGIAQIFINLVDNALKFAAAAEPRRIVIAAKRTGPAQVGFVVRDFGPGFAESERKRLFDLFYRPTDTTAGNPVSGTGIGLALVHELVVGMGGTVEARNASPGAAFELTLPLRNGTLS